MPADARDRVDALKKLLRRRPNVEAATERRPVRVRSRGARLRVAYFSPMPPERSGIADYSALLLPALRRRLDVGVVARGRKRPPRGTDICLYHVGNNPEAHGWIVEALRRTPGVVVLHDFV